MSGHTPAPWRLMKSFPCVVWAGTEDEPVIVADKSGHDPVDIANARLIAAAPRLLAALRQLANAVETRQRQHHCPGFDCNVCTPCAELNEARDAIDQAEGTP